MTLVMQLANESVDLPFFKCPQANLHQGPRKHLPKAQFQHKKYWLVGGSILEGWGSLTCAFLMP